MSASPSSGQVLALITARGGSKRLPGKNVRPLGGKPLIQWTVEASLACPLVHRTILSTDDLAIADAARACGCEVPFMRPEALAHDTASSVDVVRHALATAGDGFDWLVLLQPTSPFRTADDIARGIAQLQAAGGRSLIAVAEPEKSPHLMFHRRADSTLQSVTGIRLADLRHTRTQDLPESYEINGALYVVHIPWFLESGTLFDDDTLSLVMPRSRSANIDTALDFAVAEAWWREGLVEQQL
jgi:CMP-N,N'-diacetyllegionaminic acid synthase